MYLVLSENHQSSLRSRNGLIAINLGRVQFEENDNVFASDSTKFQFICTPCLEQLKMQI